uniref:Si:dkeyp-81f3.4 n=1 Tax=Stegastes partitus TaxID=144197 RepID=A0A3B5AYV7_9TELE
MDRYSHDLAHTAESAQLVKTLLEMKRHKSEQPAGAQTEDVQWAASEHFTVEVGKQQIESYIKTWEMQSCWLHSLDFLHCTEEQYHSFHHYRARFSTPTPRRPVRGTASVYFAVLVSKVKPQSLPVEVYFTVESNRLVHTAGRSRFAERWLVDVIESNIFLNPFVFPLFIRAPDCEQKRHLFLSVRVQI